MARSCRWWQHHEFPECDLAGIQSSYRNVTHTKISVVKRSRSRRRYGRWWIECYLNLLEMYRLLFIMINGCKAAWVVSFVAQVSSLHARPKDRSQAGDRQKYHVLLNLQLRLQFAFPFFFLSQISVSFPPRELCVLKQLWLLFLWKLSHLLSVPWCHLLPRDSNC